MKRHESRFRHPVRSFTAFLIAVAAAAVGNPHLIRAEPVIPTTAPAVRTAMPATAPAGTSGAPADDISPGLLVFALLAVAVCAIVVALLVVAGLAFVVVTMGLLFVGVLSSSALVGVLRRSPGAAARAAIVQVGALAGVPFGLAGVWLLNRGFRLHHGAVAVTAAGVISGLASGAAAGFGLNLIWGQFARVMGAGACPAPAPAVTTTNAAVGPGATGRGLRPIDRHAGE